MGSKETRSGKLKRVPLNYHMLIFGITHTFHGSVLDTNILWRHVRAWSMHLHTLSGDWRVRLEFQCSGINMFTYHLLFSNAALNLVSYILLMHIPKVKSINNNIFQSHYKISWDTIIFMYQDNNTRPIRKRKFADWFRKETHSNKDLWGYIIMCSKYDIQRI